MRFTNIQLPSFVIESLYPDQLVVIKKASEIKHPLTNIATTTQPVFKEEKWYLGGYKKNIIIIVKDSTTTFLEEALLTFLQSILTACKLTLEDIAIINYLQQPIPYSVLIKQLKPSSMIMFDVNSNDLAVPFILPDYQVSAYLGCNFLYAPSLTLMTSNQPDSKQHKSNLWTALKKLFNI